MKSEWLNISKSKQKKWKMKNYEAICHYLENKIKTFKIRQSRKNVA